MTKRSAILCCALLLAACRPQQLLRDLSEQQANEVVAVLQAQALSVRKEDRGKAGFAVQVEQADFPAAVDLLKQYDLPSRTRVDVAAAFPADALVASPQAEQARLLSAVEQRLEQSLAALPEVTRARVQVSYPLRQAGSGKAEPPMRAAVLITYRNDVDESVLVGEVKRFVKNSFTNIDYDDISVLLYRTPAVYRSAAAPPAAGAPPWYALPTLALTLAAAAMSAAMLLRRRRAAMPAPAGAAP